jgi:hypothetical protein
MSQYQIPKEDQAVQKLLDDIGDAIQAITPGSDDDIRQAAMLIQGDMAIARKAASDLTGPGRAITLSISYFQEATLRYRSLSTGESALREALSCVKQAISYMPSPHYYILQGHIYADLDERWEALNAMEKATELPEAPGSEEARKEFLKLKTRYSLEEDKARKKTETEKKDKVENRSYGLMLIKYCGITFAIMLLLGKVLPNTAVGIFIEKNLVFLGFILNAVVVLSFLGLVFGIWIFVDTFIKQRK